MRRATSRQPLAETIVTRMALVLPAALLLAGACADGDAGRPPAVDREAVAAAEAAMDTVGEGYARLALALGTHDPDYVDAYYGPPEWRAEAEAAPLPLDTIRARAAALAGRLGDAPAGLDTLERLRHHYLGRQLASLATRAEMLQGRELSFDEESRLLYDATAPTHPESHFQEVLDRLDSLLPGSGPVAERYVRFREEFTIPSARLDTVFQTAIAACRERTSHHVVLPRDESFTVEYVTDKPWSGYNWYQGEYRSLIQVNTDLPIYIDRALDLACHEGYPGHHVYNVLLEQQLVRRRGWPEFSVYPLFSPQSLIAEGSANHGIEMAFPGEARVRFERDTLFPLAGLDPSRAAAYYRVQALVRELSYAGNESARRYLDGEIDAAAAAEWLTRYALMSPAAAAQRVRFFDRYRSYVINYNLGQDLVREYVERAAGPDADEARRWDVFADLLSSPRVPSGLR